MPSSELTTADTPYHQTYGKAFEHDGQLLVQNVLQYLPLAVRLNDHDRLSYYIRRLHNLLDSRLSDTILTLQQRIQLIELLQYVLTTEYPTEQELKDGSTGQFIELHLQSKCMQALRKLLEWKSIPVSDLHIEWRPLYALLEKYHFKPAESEFAPSGQLLKDHLALLVRLIGKSRKYFGSAAVDEIFNEFLPLSCPVDTLVWRSAALLTLFTPTNSKSYDKWSTRIAELSSISHFSESAQSTQLIYIHFYARLAKHQMGTAVSKQIALLMPRLLNTYLQSLELDTAGKPSQTPHTKWQSYGQLIGAANSNPLEWLSKYLAKLIVYTMQGPQSTTFKLLTQFLTTTSNYFHPSNSGRWSGPLGVLLSELGRYYSCRRGKELRKEAHYDEQYNLDTFDITYAELLLNITHTGLYSKSGGMVTASLRCIRHIAYWHPTIVFPRLMADVEFALTDVTSSHRAMSILQALANVAQPLLSRQIYPAGATYLEQLLYLSLPGIDPIDMFKTSYTLSWLSVLFYTVPLIPATGDAGGSLQKVASINSKSPVATLHPPPDNVDDLNEDARTATLRFEEWSLQFVDALFGLLSTQEKFAKKDYVAVMLASLTFRVMRAFLSALSPEVYALVIKKLLKFTSENSNLEAVKFYSLVCSAAGLVEPSTFLAAIFKQQYPKILSAQGSIAAGAHDNDLAWNTRLLAGSVRHAGGGSTARNALLPHVEQIQAIYKALHNHSSKQVRKAANKLVKNTLRALTTTYPAEYRSLVPSDWNSKQTPHHLLWASYTPPTSSNHEVVDAQIDWHVPTAEELKAAESLFSLITVSSVKQLNHYAAGQSLEVAKQLVEHPTASSGAKETPNQIELLETELQHLLQAVNGAQSVLGEISGEDAKPDNDKADNGSRVPITPIRRTQPIAALQSKELLQALTAGEKSITAQHSLRTALLIYTHTLTQRALSADADSRPSIKAHNLLVKLIHRLLSRWGVTESKLYSDRHQGSQGRKWMRDYVHQHKGNSLRPQLVTRAYEYHQQRVAESGYSQPFTVDVRNVIDDLQQLAVNDFKALRERAKDTLIDAVRRYPMSIDSSIKAMTAIIGDEKQTAEAVQGALHVLSNYTMIGWIVRKYSRLHLWVEAICVHSAKHKDDKVQILIQETFNGMYTNIYATNVRVPTVSKDTKASGKAPALLQSAPVSDSQLQNRNRNIDNYSGKQLDQYVTLLKYVLEQASRGQDTLHWRYSLMCSAVLFALLQARYVNQYPKQLEPLHNQIAIHYSTTLCGDLMPMRRIALTALSKIYGLHGDSLHKWSRRSATVEDAKQAPKQYTDAELLTPFGSDQEFTAAHIQDYTYSQWLPVPGSTSNVVYTQYGGSSTAFDIAVTGKLPVVMTPWSAVNGVRLSDDTKKQIKQLLTSHMSSVATLIVNGHTALAASADSQSKQQSGAGDKISDLAASTASAALWPFTHVLNTSKAFDPANLSFIRGVVEIYPELVLQSDSPLIKELERLLNKGAEQDHQCAAAEIIGGIFKASLHWSVADQQRTQQLIIKWVETALVNCQADSVQHYHDSLRFAFTNVDPRRVASITKHMLGHTLGALPSSVKSSDKLQLESSPAVLYKRLRFFLPLLIEFSTRSQSLSVYILQHIQQQRLMYHPYKQVREEIAWLLYVTFDNLTRVERIEGKGCKQPVEAYAAVDSSAATQFLQYVSAELDKHASVYSEGAANGTAGVLQAAERGVHVLNGHEAENGSPRSAQTKSDSKLITETVIYWFMRTIATAPQTYFISTTFTVLLPHVIRAQRHLDLETAAIAKGATSVAAWIAFSGPVIRSVEGKQQTVNPVEQIIQTLEAALLHADSTYRYKVSILKYLQIFIVRHSLLITQNEELVKQIQTLLVEKLLLDGSIEVRDETARTLHSFLTSTRQPTADDISHQNNDDDMSDGSGVTSHRPVEHLTKREQELITRFTKLAKVVRTKKDGATKRHAGVLGLSTIISLYPYTLPQQLPPVLALLSNYINDGMPISGHIRKLFAEFIKSHQDEWQFFKQQFTEEQLDAVNSVSGAQSYFA